MKILDFFSALKSADIIKQLFRPNTANLFNKRLNHNIEEEYAKAEDAQYIDRLNMNEKLLVVAMEAYNEKEMNLDPWQSASIALSGKDLNDFVLASVIVENRGIDVKEMIEIFRKSKTFYEKFQILSGKQTFEIEALLDVFLKNEGEQNKKSIVDRYFDGDDDMMKNFFICLVASYIELENEKKSHATEKDILAVVRAYEETVKSFQNEYNQWKAIIGKNIQTQRSLDRVSQGIDTNPIDAYATMRRAFIQHYDLEDPRHFVFEECVAELCENPIKKLTFVEHLKRNKYGTFFCEEYATYCRNQSIEAVFDISSVIGKPELLRDKDNNHKEWFEPIPQQLYSDNEHLYLSTKKLYKTLLEKEFIESSVLESIFIYRFTGFLEPFGIEEHNKIKWKRQKNELASLMNFLYTVPDAEIVPPYTKLSNFFSPSVSNGSGLFSSAKEDVKTTIKDILQECGFKIKK